MIKNLVSADTSLFLVMLSQIYRAKSFIKVYYL